MTSQEAVAAEVRAYLAATVQNARDALNNLETPLGTEKHDELIALAKRCGRLETWLLLLCAAVEEHCP